MQAIKKGGGGGGQQPLTSHQSRYHKIFKFLLKLFTLTGIAVLVWTRLKIPLHSSITVVVDISKMMRLGTRWQMTPIFIRSSSHCAIIFIRHLPKIAQIMGGHHGQFLLNFGASPLHTSHFYCRFSICIPQWMIMAFCCSFLQLLPEIWLPILFWNMVNLGWNLTNFAWNLSAVDQNWTIFSFKFDYFWLKFDYFVNEQPRVKLIHYAFRCLWETPKSAWRCKLQKSGGVYDNFYTIA